MPVTSTPRSYAAGHFRFLFGDNTQADYLNRFGIEIPFAVDSFGYSAQNLKEYFDFGMEEFLIHMNSREVSKTFLTHNLGLAFAAAAAAPADTLIPGHEEQVVPAGLTITLAQAPSPATSLNVHGITGGIDQILLVNAGAPGAGEFQLSAPTVITFNVAQQGMTAYVDYTYSSVTVGLKAATTPTSFVPAAVSGLGMIRLGPQNATRAMWLVCNITNMVRAGGSFKVDVDHNKIGGGYDLSYAITSSSTAAWNLV